jgi:hypothetical protein
VVSLSPVRRAGLGAVGISPTTVFAHACRNNFREVASCETRVQVIRPWQSYAVRNHKGGSIKRRRVARFGSRAAEREPAA